MPNQLLIQPKTTVPILDGQNPIYYCKSVINALKSSILAPNTHSFHSRQGTNQHSQTIIDKANPQQSLHVCSTFTRINAKVS